MSQSTDDLAIALFSEIFSVGQLGRSKLSKALPKGMELNHFAVLNYLAGAKTERTPADLARVFSLTRGAMTNTLSKLEWAGHVHIRPDWEDARRKLVAISPAGRHARDEAIAAIAPIISGVVTDIGTDRTRSSLPLLRELRERLSADAEPGRKP